MNKKQISKYFSKLGKRGGKTHTKEHFSMMGKISAEKRKQKKLDKLSVEKDNNLSTLTLTNG